MTEESNIEQRESGTGTIVTMKGKQYILATLPKEIQDLISVYVRFEGELSNAKVEVFKLEAAMKQVGREIDLRMARFGKESDLEI
jgi:hypothetical protein